MGSKFDASSSDVAVRDVGCLRGLLRVPVLLVVLLVNMMLILFNVCGSSEDIRCEGKV